MRAYFIILSGLLLVAVFVSYKIVTTLAFDRVNDQPISRPKLAANDNDTSACFEKRYSPQIQACGGLLTYSPPAVSYRISENRKQPPVHKRRHLSGRLAPEQSNKTGAALGKFRHPSVPSHSDMARTFE